MSILNLASGAGVASETLTSPMSPARSIVKPGGGGGRLSSGGGASQEMHGGGGSTQLWARAAGAPTSTASAASAGTTIAERIKRDPTPTAEVKQSTRASVARTPGADGDRDHRDRVTVETEEAPASRRGLSN